MSDDNEMLTERAKFYYRQSRKRVSDRPPWEDIENSNDPYNVGMRETAYQQARDELSFTRFDIDYFQHLKITHFDFGKPIRIVNTINGDVFDIERAKIFVRRYQRTLMVGQIRYIELPEEELLFHARDIKEGRIDFFIKKD